MTDEQLAAIRALLAAGQPIPPELGRVLLSAWSRNLRELLDTRTALVHWGHVAKDSGPLDGMARVVADLAERGSIPASAG